MQLTKSGARVKSCLKFKLELSKSKMNKGFSFPIKILLTSNFQNIKFKTFLATF